MMLRPPRRKWIMEFFYVINKKTELHVWINDTKSSMPIRFSPSVTDSTSSIVFSPLAGCWRSVSTHMHWPNISTANCHNWSTRTGTNSLSATSMALDSTRFISMAWQHEIFIPPYPYQCIALLRQGGILTFNLLKQDGSHYGFNAFRRVAEMEAVDARTGCFCNVGACQRYVQ